MNNLDKILNVATKIRTPLSIAGLIIIILYLIVRQILDMQIFTEVGKENSFLLINSILDKIFWLALVSLILGISSYLITILIKKKSRKTSNVSIIDSSNDEKMSNYIETTETKGVKIIKPDDKN
ncbi:hypothetical protein [Tenacibaculum xiamenense]|uniref:hypothetical protein n=1 Tax=Tenacibaculum xiamenense TaxID=1261553 RepID=UPI003894D04E